MKVLYIVQFLFFSTLLSAQSKKPQVLVLADSIYNEPVRAAAQILKDRVDLSYGKYSAYHSAQALENFDKLLEGKKWDLIYFNYGLNDLMYKDPSIKSLRAMHKDVGGVRVSSPQQYEKNLNELVKRFKAKGIKLVWGATTPIVGSNGVLYAGDEIEFNEIAARVMKTHSVPVVDMHSFGAASHKTMPRGHGKTYSYKGGTALHPPLVNSILKELNLFKPVNGPVKVYIMAGDSQISGQGLVADTKKPRAGKAGTLDELVLNPQTAARYKHLIDNKSWSQRSDVWVSWEGKNTGKLSIGYGERGNMIGPELGFGHVMGDHITQQVLIYKANVGKTVLNDFFSKNGSYKNMLESIQDSFKNLAHSFPDYSDNTKYEICGLILSFGKDEKDLKSFENNLTKLINELRRDLKEPTLPVIVLGTGIEGSKYTKTVQLQKSVAEKLNSVSFLDARPFWPDKSKSPDKSPERWFGNAESFYRLGTALAEEMKKLK